MMRPVAAISLGFGALLIGGAGSIACAGASGARPPSSAERNPNDASMDAKSGRPPIPTKPYFTKLGRQYIEPSEVIVLGRVRGVSPIPSGPSVVRFEVERWISAPPQEAKPKTIPVSAPPGALSISETPMILFLGSPDRAGGFVRTLVARSEGDVNSQETYIAWIQKEREVAALASPAERLAVMKTFLIENLRSESHLQRRLALTELDAWASSTRESYFAAGDADRIEGIAPIWKTKDKETALQILDLAERIRAKIR